MWMALAPILQVVKRYNSYGLRVPTTVRPIDHVDEDYLGIAAHPDNCATKMASVLRCDYAA